MAHTAQKSTTGRRNIARRHDLIASLVLILGSALRERILIASRGMTDLALAEWIETEMQTRQAA